MDIIYIHSIYLYITIYIYIYTYIVDLCSKGLHFSAHTSCLLGWVKLVPSHSCCCPWWCPISKMLRYLQQGCTSTSTFSWALFLDCDLASYIVPNLLEPLQSWVFYFIWFCVFTSGLSSDSSPDAQFHASCLQKQYDFRNFNITKLSCQHKLQPWLLLDHSFSSWLCRKYFSLHLCQFLLKYSWLFSPSWPVSVAPVKQRFHFRGLSLWMTADISAPADQNHTVLKLKISNSPHIVFKGFPKLPSEMS